MLKTKLTLSQLEQNLSKAAWILKGPVEASDFKVYIFPLLFFKGLSEVYVEEYELALEESDCDVKIHLYRKYKVYNRYRGIIDRI